MGIGSFSPGELQVLNDKFSAINSGLNALESNISAEVQRINSTVSSMKATGVTILDEPSIKGLFDDVRKKFSFEQKKLETIISEFKAATEAYEAKRQELYDKEEDIIARESQADKEFASKREIQMAPLRGLQEELDKKQRYLMSLQKEYNDSFRAREQQLVADFQKLNDQLQVTFNELQQQVLADRQTLAERENAVSKREKDVSKREVSVKDGLAEERSQMMADIDVEKSNIEDQKSELDNQRQALKEEQSQFETEKGELEKRNAEVYKRERKADEGFADERAKMQDDIQKMRQNCLAHIKVAEESASENRNQLLKGTIALFEQERSRSVNSLNEELVKRRAEADVEIKKEKEKIQQENANLRKEKAATETKENELQKREMKIKIEEERQTQEKIFLAEKMRIDEEKFRKIAEERIVAATEEANAVRKANEELSAQLTSLRLQYEEQKAINDRFKDQSVEEIFDKLQKLEIENKRLHTQVKNHSH